VKQGYSVSGFFKKGNEEKKNPSLMRSWQGERTHFFSPNNGTSNV
jgi:hypothetical protein